MRTTGPDLALLGKADGVQIYHWARYECGCVEANARTGKAKDLDCSAAVPPTDCQRLKNAVDALRAAIVNAEIVRMGTLAGLENQVPLPKEQRAAIADLMDACREAD